ncbi:Tyrosinase central domain-containing protein [Mycena venus]|uniref:Tyrosinase central domain-containing protein n=1 Tax=Mycena venus TaxID=2733690 RepID=A0A8H6XGZ9_9AGAR|nr:Tyrosinase central domain-containing protein [Mycena venus]
MASEPFFPAELEREIFETTASMHPSAIPTVLRVARRVLIWIEPLLYRVVCSHKQPEVLSATKSKPPAFFHDAVRHLLLDGVSTGWSVEEANDVLRLCTGVTNFAAIGKFSNPSLLPILEGMKIQRLAACLEVLFGDPRYIDLCHRAFSSITHFDIFDEIVSGETTICCKIPMLPALTHLCLNNDVPLNTVQGLLTDCPRLDVFVVLCPDYSWAKKTPISDMRFVVAFVRDYWNDWERGARGLPNFWSVADNFVTQKRRGLIDKDCYWIDDYDKTRADLEAE